MARSPENEFFKSNMAALTVLSIWDTDQKMIFHSSNGGTVLSVSKDTSPFSVMCQKYYWPL